MKPIAQNFRVFGVTMTFYKWIDTPFRYLPISGTMGLVNRDSRQIHLAVQSQDDTITISMSEDEYYKYWSTNTGTPANQIDATFLKKEIIDSFEYQDQLRIRKGEEPNPKIERIERYVMSIVDSIFESIDSWDHKIRN